jgi:hypothetical protein
MWGSWVESNAHRFRVLLRFIQIDEQAEEPRVLLQLVGDLLQSPQYHDLEVAHFLSAEWMAATAAEAVLAVKAIAVGCSKVAEMIATTLKVVIRGVPIVAPAVSKAVTTALAVPEA